MTGTTRTSADFDPRRRRLLYHAWHRGTREMDLLMGRFADALLGELDESELRDLESLMHVPDPDLFSWITGNQMVPANYDTSLMRRIIAFYAPADRRP